MLSLQFANQPAGKTDEAIARRVRALVSVKGRLLRGRLRSRRVTSRWRPSAGFNPSEPLRWEDFHEETEIGFGEPVRVPVVMRPDRASDTPNVWLFGEASLTGQVQLDGSGTPPFSGDVQLSVRFEGPDLESVAFNFQLDARHMSVEPEGFDLA